MSLEAGFPHEADWTLALKVIGGIMIVVGWLWRAAVNYSRYQALREDFKIFKEANYVTATQLQEFKKACRTEVELSQRTVVSDLSAMVGILIAKVDILLEERGYVDNTSPAHRRRKTDYPCGVSIPTRQDTRIPQSLRSEQRMAGEEDSGHD